MPPWVTFPHGRTPQRGKAGRVPHAGPHPAYVERALASWFFIRLLKLNTPGKPPFEICAQRRRDPRATVILVLPGEYVVAANGAGTNGETELVAVACVSEEEEAVEWHIELSKVRVGSE